MRIRATCHSCGRDFLFFQLYNADSWHTDKCPQCNVHLGVVGLRHLALAADRAGASFLNALDQIAAREPRFTIKAATVLDRLEATVAELAEPAEQQSDRNDAPSLRQWWKQRRAA